MATDGEATMRASGVKVEQNLMVRNFVEFSILKLLHLL